MVTVLSLLGGIDTFLITKQLGRFWLSLVLVVSRNNVEQIFILVCIVAFTSE